MNKHLLPIISALAIGAAAVPAQASDNRAESAMSKGIRDYARVVADGAKVSGVKLDAKPVSKVGARAAVSGSFRLTLGGKTVTYRLTSSARVVRLSPAAIEYRLAAKAANATAGLPGSTGAFTGFFQGPAARES